MTIQLQDADIQSKSLPDKLQHTHLIVTLHVRRYKCNSYKNILSSGICLLL